MSLYDYQAAQQIKVQGYPFYALVMAAMYKADTDNMERLTAAFPDTAA